MILLNENRTSCFGKWIYRITCFSIINIINQSSKLNIIYNDLIIKHEASMDQWHLVEILEESNSYTKQQHEINFW